MSWPVSPLLRIRSLTAGTTESATASSTSWFGSFVRAWWLSEYTAIAGIGMNDVEPGRLWIALFPGGSYNDYSSTPRKIGVTSPRV